MGFLARVRGRIKDEALEVKRAGFGGVLRWNEKRIGEELEGFEVGFTEGGRWRREV